MKRNVPEKRAGHLVHHHLPKLKLLLPMAVPATAAGNCEGTQHPTCEPRRSWSGGGQSRRGAPISLCCAVVSPGIIATGILGVCNTASCQPPPTWLGCSTPAATQPATLATRQCSCHMRFSKQRCARASLQGATAERFGCEAARGWTRPTGWRKAPPKGEPHPGCLAQCPGPGARRR